MENVECPVCRQDWVRRYRVTGTQRELWLCAECDSAWLSRESIGAWTSEYLPKLLGDEWQAVERIEE